MGEQNTLLKFGHKFQTKIISSLLGEKVFLQTICDILEPEYFDADSNKWIAQTIRDYFFEYKTSPTLEVMKVKIDEIENDILKVAVVDGLKESWRLIQSTDLKFVQEQTLEFCRNQVIKAAILESVDLLEVGQYDEIKKMVDEAMKAGSERDLGHDYIDGIEERLTKSSRETVKTGWDPIDELMDGGLDGISEIRKIIKKSSELIKNGGKLVLEIAYNQKEEVKLLLKKNSFYINSVVKDLAKNDRCIISTKIKK